MVAFRRRNSRSLTDSSRLVSRRRNSNRRPRSVRRLHSRRRRNNNSSNTTNRRPLRMARLRLRTVMHPLRFARRVTRSPWGPATARWVTRSPCRVLRRMRIKVRASRLRNNNRRPRSVDLRSRSVARRHLRSVKLRRQLLRRLHSVAPRRLLPHKPQASHRRKFRPRWRQVRKRFADSSCRSR